MTDYNLPGENPHDLPKRAVRALTEKMTVLPNTGRVKDADDLYLVVSESGSEYLVDTCKGRCDCPDARHNLEPDEQCKHERRVLYATGKTVLPVWVNTDAIDPHLGIQTETSPLHAVTDGGMTGEDAGKTVVTTEDGRSDTPDLDEQEHNECGCAELSEDLCCWPCVRDGKRGLP